MIKTFQISLFRKYYDSISNLPVSIFHKIIKTGNHSLLCYKGRISDKLAFELWEKIYAEFVDEFGLPDDYIKYLEGKLKAVKLWHDSINGGKRHLKALAQIEDIKAEQYLKDDIESNITLVSANISKYMGFRLDVDKVSTKEFYSYVELLKNEPKTALNGE